MPKLFLFNRRGSRGQGDLLVAGRRSAPQGWVFREGLDASSKPSSSTHAYVVWRRRWPRAGHAITTGNVPAADGDWSVEHVIHAPRINGIAIEEVPSRRPVPPEYEMSLVKPLFLDLLDLLNRHDFPYWADAGTLLGTIRHGGIIPWDKDCDLGILRKNRQALITLIHSSPGFTVRYETGPTMWVVSAKYDIRVTDVFTYTFRRRFRAAFWDAHAAKYGVDVSAGYLVYDQPMFRTYLDQRFNTPWSLFHPQRLAPFYDRRIKVANRARTLLKGMYGERCLTHMSTDSLNSEGSPITSFAPL
jgi:hypothetical protein